MDLSDLTTLVELVEETAEPLAHWHALILHQSQWHTLFVRTTEMVGEIETELCTGDPFKAKRDLAQFMRETGNLCERLSRVFCQPESRP